MALAVRFDVYDEGMPHDVELLRDVIVEQLRRDGVQLPEERITALADVVLAEAVRISLRWLENG